MLFFLNYAYGVHTFTPVSLLLWCLCSRPFGRGKRADEESKVRVAGCSRSHGSESKEFNWLITWKTSYNKWEPGPKSIRGTCDEMIRQYKATGGKLLIP